ncbi:Mu-like prophage major head subunit gpT family protein [Endozoicomonas gorgoniicola]|uniref:Mu-like prophage major head subunit gpT family protein n=1 Tax=Endozoicomonas gorgoniicola TaxID=1234144 RepID=A0ABT3N2M4_9GAMM|nr:Mu-like prophage major head subunit gpT family protein [Endozoicomonas gorgoniicola]MCW7555885.1 Mu-like prophage major head subunit gpT family protein [Endozoicomonas gorgoniicola]
MIITPSSVSALFTTFRALYDLTYKATPSHWRQVATLINSGTRSNTYGWLGQFPDFREWIGDREIKSLQAYGYEIENKSWESTIAVSRTEIEDDNIGVFSPIFKEMARAAKVFPDKQVFQLLEQGFTAQCYDNKPFFASDHSVGASKVSNMQAGSSEAWFLLDTSRPLKPLIYQEREKPQFVRRDQAHDDPVFIKNEAQYGVDMRCNVGFGLWQTAFGSKAELNTDNFNDAWGAMTAFKSPEGRPLGITPTLLVVPPKLRTRAFEVVKAERLANGGSNVNHNLVEVLICPWLA